MTVELVLFLLAGFVIGVCLTILIQRFRKPFGIIQVDMTDHDIDKASIIIGNLEDLYKKRRVILEIRKVKMRENNTPYNGGE